MRIRAQNRGGQIVHLCPASSVTKSPDVLDLYPDARHEIHLRSYQGFSLCGRHVNGFNEDAKRVEALGGAPVCKLCMRALPNAQAQARALGNRFRISEPGRNEAK